jgi:oligogalacturonide transport system permease protein
MTKNADTDPNFKPRRQKIRVAPYVLLIPWFIGISLFRIYPIVMSFWYSLRNYHPIGGDRGFVGFQNYTNIFSMPLFWDSVRATLKYVLLGTPMVLAAAFFIAFILNFKLKGVNLFRTAYYVPSILGGNVAVSLLWIQLFSANGPINALIRAVGMEPVSWLRTVEFAPFTLVFLSAWQFGSVMLIFLAALQNVSPTLYEAASIDGASKRRQLFVITLPIITPVLLFNTINVLLRHFSEFNSAFLITERGPANATYFLNILIYEFAFRQMRFGVASALTWIFLAGIGVLTIILFISSKYWVHYND